MKAAKYDLEGARKRDLKSSGAAENFNTSDLSYIQSERIEKQKENFNTKDLIYINNEGFDVYDVLYIQAVNEYMARNS